MNPEGSVEVIFPIVALVDQGEVEVTVSAITQVGRDIETTTLTILVRDTVMQAVLVRYTVMLAVRVRDTVMEAVLVRDTVMEAVMVRDTVMLAVVVRYGHHNRISPVTRRGEIRS